MMDARITHVIMMEFSGIRMAATAGETKPEAASAMDTLL